MAGRHEPGSHTEDHGIGNTGEELHEREVRRDQPLRGDARLQVVAAESMEPLAGGRFMDERLRLPDAGQALLEVGVHDGDPLAGHVVQHRGPAPEDHGGRGQRHDDGEGAETELEVEQHERDADPDEGDERDEGQQQAVLDQRLELVDVRGHPGHDPAGHLALVVVEREPLQLGPDPDAQRQHDPLRDPAGDERLADLVDQVGQGDRQVDRGGAEERRLRAGRHAVVQSGLDQHRPRQRGQGVEDDEEQPEQQLATERREQPPQPELPLVPGLPLQVDARAVPDRAQRGDPLEQLGRRREVQPPAAAPATPEPGPDARGAERPGGEAATAWPSAGRPSGVPRRRRGAGGPDPSGQRLDPVPDLLPVLIEPGQECTVRRAPFDQLFVVALRRNASGLQDDDPVGQMEGGPAVGHEQHRAVGQALAQALVDRLLGGRVDGRRRVVEDQDARVGEQGPGQRHPLSLPTRQAEPAFPDRGVVAPRQLGDELVRLGHPGHGLDLGIGGTGPAVRDVVPHRRREQEALLEHHRHLPAQRLQSDRPDVDTVDEDGTGVGVVEPRDHERRRGRAAAARAQDRHPLPRGDGQVQPVQHRLPVAVPEVHVAEGHLAAQGRQARRRPAGRRWPAGGRAAGRSARCRPGPAGRR